jgi:hypothetical protein
MTNIDITRHLKAAIYVVESRKKDYRIACVMVEMYVIGR